MCWCWWGSEETKWMDIGNILWTERPPPQERSWIAVLQFAQIVVIVVSEDVCFVIKHLFWRRWSSFWSSWGGPTTGSRGPPLDQRRNFDPLVGPPPQKKTKTTWDRRLKHTSPESLFQDLSFGVKIIFLSHVVAEQNEKQCAVETGETSWGPATGSLLYQLTQATFKKAWYVWPFQVPSEMARDSFLMAIRIEMMRPPMSPGLECLAVSLHRYLIPSKHPCLLVRGVWSFRYTGTWLHNFRVSPQQVHFRFVIHFIFWEKHVSQNANETFINACCLSTAVASCDATRRALGSLHTGYVVLKSTGAASQTREAVLRQLRVRCPPLTFRI